MAPRISILLPVCNGERFVGQCLASVLAQSLPDFELLVGDDCSKDGTPAILKEHLDPRIEIFRWEHNLGLFPNLNRLLERARAPLVRFVCQDDVLGPGCLAAEVDFFRAHPGIGMSFCKTTRINQSGVRLGACRLHDLPEIIEPLNFTRLLFFCGCLPGNLSTVCVTRRALDSVGRFDSSFGVSADYELWARISRRCDLGVLHQRLVRLRSHAAQLSRCAGSELERILANERIRDFLLESLPNEERAAAESYSRWRYDVRTIHYAWRQLGRARFNELIQALRSLGLDRFLFAGLAWALTLNNRLYRPGIPNQQLMPPPLIRN